MKGGIVFDLDGTLVDSREDLAASMAHVLALRGHPPRTFDEVAARVGHGARRLVERCLPEGTAPDEVEATLAAFRVHYGEHLADRTRPFPGIAEALSLLGRERPLAVLTNKPGAMARALTAQLGLDRYLDQVLGPDDVGALKPEPAGLLEAFRRLDVAVERSWYVGDMPLDVEAARAAGCRVAAVCWGLSTEAALEASAPDRLLRAPTELGSLD